MQRELRRQEAARRSFVATASHELRTPLTSLQGTIELLEEDLRAGRLDQEEPGGRCAGAQRELRRLARLASELLDLSRLDADVSLREEPVELGELCRAVAAEFELRAAEREGRPRGPRAARAVLGPRRSERRGPRRAHPARQRAAPCAGLLDRPRRARLPRRARHGRRGRRRPGRRTRRSRARSSSASSAAAPRRARAASASGSPSAASWPADGRRAAPRGHGRRGTLRPRAADRAARRARTRSRTRFPLRT